MSEPSRAASQLALPLRLPEAAGFERFVADGNLEVLTAVRAWCRGAGAPYVFLHGASGKTHLLQSAAADLARRGRAVLYLPLDQPGLTPAVLDDLERLDAVLLDALDAIAGQPLWEEAVFDLYNRLQVHGRRLLIAARSPPSQLPLGLGDLGSRLMAGPAYGLKPLDDAGRARLLRRGAELRGLRLSDAVVAYLLARCPRDPAWLATFLERLDQATLAEQRAPTVPFVGRLLDTVDGTQGLPPR